MLLLNKESLNKIGIDWDKTTQVIDETVRCLQSNDFSQPVKPYLRYRNRKNRIIAMPAFVGGGINLAGIKWISSFPDNIKSGIPRAHCVVILNDPDTGEPVGIINTALLSTIRTASVSGLMMKYYFNSRRLENLRIGIIGFGPIGQAHLKMCRALFGKSIESIVIYDKKDISCSIGDDSKISIANCWEDSYLNSDIVITCTVSDTPYIDKPPKAGSLHLNVSLRDYKTDIYPWFENSIIVDNWEEVCREKTDIEMMHLEKGLEKEQTKSIIDVVTNNAMEDYAPEIPIMFNPMGMAVFDVAIGGFYYKVEGMKKSDAVLTGAPSL